MSSTVATPPRKLDLLLQGEVVIPAWVDDLESYCRWRLSDEAPTHGEIAFLDTGIWVDLRMEEFLTHNQVKAAYDFAIMSIVQQAASGRYVPDRMLFRNAQANLSSEPDGLYFTWETVRSGRLLLVDKPGQGVMELEGTTDLVLEIVSKTSVNKDTVLLRDLYWRAGVTEYWLVDARDGHLAFEILQHTPNGYVSTPAVGGWVASTVLDKKFQLQQRPDPLGHPQFFVVWAD
jgi:Uma2 family endonuclease